MITYIYNTILPVYIFCAKNVLFVTAQKAYFCTFSSRLHALPHMQRRSRHWSNYTHTNSRHQKELKKTGHGKHNDYLPSH